MSVLIVIGFIYIIISLMGWRAVRVILVFVTGGLWIIPWIAIELSSKDKQ